MSGVHVRFANKGARGDDRQGDRHADSKAEGGKDGVTFHGVSRRRGLFASCRSRYKTLDRGGDVMAGRLKHLVQGHH